MYHQPIHPVRTRVEPSSPGTLLPRAAIATLAMTTFAALFIGLAERDTLPSLYFFQQDLPLLVASAIALLLLARLSPARGAPIFIGGREIAWITALVAALAYAGSFLVLQRYALSRDEALADFAAQTYRQGHLARSIPAQLRGLGDALMPLSAGSHIATGYWLSDYLPVASLLRTAAGLIGDRWLAGPLLLAIGAAGLWSSARRIWPGRRDAAVVATMLALSSTQLVANAMTPYAMSAHFAFDAVWLACFLRGGRGGIAATVVISLLAIGLHQIHFHIIFMSGFVVWTWLSGRRALSLLYVAVIVVGCIGWQIGYRHLLIDWALGSPTGAGPAVKANLASYFGRLGQLEPISSLARFAAWQNVLLLPLALAGARQVRDADGGGTVLYALRLSCLVGLATLVYQGHGLGYRYLHGLIPAFCLLAAGGWVAWGEALGRALPARLLWASVVFATLVTAPFALWRSHQFIAPYAAAYRAARAAPADVVLVDDRGGLALQDIVRVDGPLSRPLLLDLAYVPTRDLARLCRDRRVMVFDGRQAAALGIAPGATAAPIAALSERGRHWLDLLHCGRPVPLPTGARTGG